MEKDLVKQIITKFVFSEFDIKSVYKFVDSDITEKTVNVHNMKVNKIRISGRKENYGRKILYKNW